MTDHYENIRAALAHEIRAAAKLAPGEGIVDDGVARIVDLLRRESHPAAELLRLRTERQRDDALLRQALEALLGQRGEPDWHTGKQREAAIAALRERLGENE